MDSAKLSSEMEILKGRLQATWTAGDFGQIAAAYSFGAERFVEQLGLQPETRVLDVACGTGNLALPAARAGAQVTGIDIALNLIEQARANAVREGLRIDFDLGDAEDMPYEDASFDVVMTMYGAMFAPRPDITANELKRVTKPGGVIAMANWTPGGFIGQMFKTTGKHVTPPAGMPSPILWGDREAVERRFADGIDNLQMTERYIDFIFPFGPIETVEHFRKFYGPTQKAFDALDKEGKAALRKDLEELWAVNNKAIDGTTLVTSEYLEVKAVRI